MNFVVKEKKLQRKVRRGRMSMNSMKEFRQIITIKAFMSGISN